MLLLNKANRKLCSFSCRPSSPVSVLGFSCCVWDEEKDRWKCRNKVCLNLDSFLPLCTLTFKLKYISVYKLVSKLLQWPLENRHKKRRSVQRCDVSLFFQILYKYSTFCLLELLDLFFYFSFMLTISAVSSLWVIVQNVRSMVLVSLCKTLLCFLFLLSS